MRDLLTVDRPPRRRRRRRHSPLACRSCGTRCARRLISATAFANAASPRSTRRSRPQTCRCSRSPRPDGARCSGSAAATRSPRDAASSSRSRPAPPSRAASRRASAPGRSSAALPGQRPPRPRRRRVRRHARARRSRASASYAARRRRPQGVRPDRVLGSHRPLQAKGVPVPDIELAEELLQIEEADAWFEYLEATRGSVRDALRARSSPGPGHGSTSACARFAPAARASARQPRSSLISSAPRAP